MRRAAQTACRVAAAGAESPPTRRGFAVDATGLPVASLVVPASTHENDANTALLEQLAEMGASDRLAVVMVDRGRTHKAGQAAAHKPGVEVRVTGWSEKTLASASCSSVDRSVA